MLRVCVYKSSSSHFLSPRSTYLPLVLLRLTSFAEKVRFLSKIWNGSESSIHFALPSMGGSFFISFKTTSQRTVSILSETEPLSSLRNSYKAPSLQVLRALATAHPDKDSFHSQSLYRKPRSLLRRRVLQKDPRAHSQVPRRERTTTTTAMARDRDESEQRRPSSLDSYNKEEAKMGGRSQEEQGLLLDEQGLLLDGVHDPRAPELHAAYERGSLLRRLARDLA